jgi:hypothetical protein
LLASCSPTPSPHSTTTQPSSRIIHAHIEAATSRRWLPCGSNNAAW